MPLDTAELYDIAGLAAYEVATTCVAGVDLDDLRQEAVLWMLENPGRVERARLEDGTINRRRVVAEVQRGLIRKLDEQAAASGRINDRERYSRRLIRHLLESAWDDEPPAKPQDGTRAHGDGALPGDWIIHKADIRAALDTLEPEARALLFYKYAQGLSWDEVSEAYEEPASTLRSHAAVSVAALARYLNGGRPPRPHTTWGGGPGSRRVLTNAAARALVEQQQDAG